MRLGKLAYCLGMPNWGLLGAQSGKAERVLVGPSAGPHFSLRLRLGMPGRGPIGLGRGSDWRPVSYAKRSHTFTQVQPVQRFLGQP